MKNFLKSLCLILMTASLSEAQIVKSIGINAGYVYATEKWNYTELSGDWIDPISTFSGGVFAETYKMQRFSLLAKIQYVGKGRSVHILATRADPTSPSGYVDVGYLDLKDRLDYICVPVLLKYSLPLSKVEPFIAMGPRFEYLVGHPSSVVYDKFKTTEWSLTFSTGVDISIHPLPKFFIEAEYNTSLTDSYTGEFVTVSDHSLEFLLGVYF